MAAPMRSSSQEAGHRPRVADSRTPPDTSQPSNFEYDDNEWDIGIGDLIIDLDADIEKTTEGAAIANTMASAPQAAKQAAAKLAIEHSATVDKGLKMKIKRTKPGTKTSEAKHEIVKSGEQNGNADQAELKGVTAIKPCAGPASTAAAPAAVSSNQQSGNSKRGSSGHRRDKARDKHSSSTTSEKPPVAVGKVGAQQTPTSEMNGIVRVSAPQTGPPRSVFPASTGPGPPQTSASGPSPGPPPSPAAATAQGSAAKPEQAKVASSAPLLQPITSQMDESSTSPPPTKKLKTETKEVTDVCVGTSVGTITEPECLGPCEPGTSVTLEGIVWHETEGGILVVNVTWRGKTYVGTLLDCTRHDWAPPRFCDSPTSDLDNRTPKGRGKRGRSAGTGTPSTDVSNFTETRSSVHSKLRNGGGGAATGGVKGRRGGNGNSGASTAPSSPTPFVPPRPEPTNKRKTRVGEEESSQTNVQGKKTKVAAVLPPTPIVVPSNPVQSGSPPPSPVLLECPEPNCSKKYKHINGLKYHQSHAHGSVDDDDTKDVTSMSENDESNIEAPSPVTPVKSPEKSQDSPATPQKKEVEIGALLRGTGNLLDVPSQPATPRSTPPSPATPQTPLLQDIGTTTAGSPNVPLVETKNVVKPGVLRYSTPEEYPVGVFSANKPPVQGTPIPMSNAGQLPTVRNVTASGLPLEQPIPQPEPTAQPQSFSNQLQSPVNMPSQQFTQPPSILIPTQSSISNPQMAPQLSPSAPPSPSQSAKVTQFKVKPTAALMPDDKKTQLNNGNTTNKLQNFKKKNRKSPAGSPLPPQAEQPMFGMEQTGRDEVQSPAYSDISDDGAPVIEPDLVDKSKNPDKKTESSQALPHMTQYGMYYYGQPQYLVPSVQQPSQDAKPKEPEKQIEKPNEKDGKKDGSEFPQKVLPQHYYPYYMAGYPYNMDPSYGGVSMVPEEKIKEERVKESPSPIDQTVKQPTPIPNPIQVPTPGKVKTDTSLMKDKHQNENHQIIKESIDLKSQMNPYMYPRQPSQQPPQQQQPPQPQIQQQQQHHQQQQSQQAQQQAQQAQQHMQQQQQQQQVQQQAQQVQQQQSHHQQREEDMRRYYVYSDQRRKEQGQISDHKSSSSQSKTSLTQSPSMKHKEPKIEDKKEKEPKQEGVKPTMETQGPPPPPTSQYAYIHPSYMQSTPYGTLPFDPNHPMYRGIMVPGPYSGNPYLHAQIPRYHGPEDLSRAPPPNKALDMLQHHAQYYSSQHKIHELQERAIKSPTPKTSVASSSPSTNTGGPPTGQPQQQLSAPPTSQPSNTAPSSGKQMPGDNKESRSPPPQRHVHTHHHTHVGLGYPMYPATYGAAVLASQQAAAVTVINPYPTK